MRATVRPPSEPPLDAEWYEVRLWVAERGGPARLYRHGSFEVETHYISVGWDLVGYPADPSDICVFGRVVTATGLGPIEEACVPCGHVTDTSSGESTTCLPEIRECPADIEMETPSCSATCGVSAGRSAAPESLGGWSLFAFLLIAFGRRRAHARPR